jgi:hypothetical protein
LPGKRCGRSDYRLSASGTNRIASAPGVVGRPQCKEKIKEAGFESHEIILIVKNGDGQNEKGSNGTAEASSSIPFAALLMPYLIFPCVGLQFFMKQSREREAQDNRGDKRLKLD